MSHSQSICVGTQIKFAMDERSHNAKNASGNNAEKIIVIKATILRVTENTIIIGGEFESANGLAMIEIIPKLSWKEGRYWYKYRNPSGTIIVHDILELLVHNNCSGNHFEHSHTLLQVDSFLTLMEKLV